MKLSIKDFFSKCDQICSFLRIRSHLLTKSLMENFIFCAVLVSQDVQLIGIQIIELHFTKRKMWIPHKENNSSELTSV